MRDILSRGSAHVLVVAGRSGPIEGLCGEIRHFAGKASIVIAENLSTAIDAISASNPDVILLALTDDGPFNLESVTLLSECVSDIPLVVLSDVDSDDTAEAVVSEGAHEYLYCPAALAGSLSEAVRNALVAAYAEGQALRADVRFRRLYENAISGIFEINASGDFIAANPAALEMLGFNSELDLLQTNLVNDICANIDHGREMLRIVISEGSIRNAEMVLRNRSDNKISVLVSAITVLDREGEVAVVEGSMIDVSERRKAQDELTYLAKFDRLTGLANRYLFKETLGKAIARAQRQGFWVALLMIDLDRFKEVNDTLGHDAGDALLRAVGSRLARSVREGDTVARLGGDEFAILIETQPDGGDGVGAVARKVLAKLGLPYTLAGHEVYVTPSIGIATSPDAGIHSDTLMKAADVAMYRAKSEGRNTYVFYSQEIHDEVMARVKLEQNLRHAMDRDEFTLVYQPKIAFDTGQIVELEALLRWASPSCGAVSPIEFIPVLERTGLINRVGRWVIHTAAHQLGRWQQSLNLPNLSLSLNLSVRQLSQHKVLLDDISQAIAAAQIEPSCLEFEVTESALMQDPEKCIQTLEAMCDLGVRVAIDDFGTGFSSLQYLKMLPIHGIKIDRTFVRETPDNLDDVAIVNATLALAQSLGLVVTAEGVETAEQVTFLRDAGCQQAQGYYFSRPQSAGVIPELLQMDSALLPERARTAPTEDAQIVVVEEVVSAGDPNDGASTVVTPMLTISRSRH